MPSIGFRTGSILEQSCEILYLVAFFVLYAMQFCCCTIVKNAWITRLFCLFPHVTVGYTICTYFIKNDWKEQKKYDTGSVF